MKWILILWFFGAGPEVSSSIQFGDEISCEMARSRILDLPRGWQPSVMFCTPYESQK